jgi:2-iminobutanoate/2-iminopropanoate deaminase
MITRRSIDVDCFVHSNPIPCATRIGPLVTSSIVVGRNPGSDVVPDDLAAQLDNLFVHVGEMLRGAGADWRHVAKMNFWVPSLDDRAAINVPWVRHFPDPASRPSRHTQVGVTVAQCDFVAFISD